MVARRGGRPGRRWSVVLLLAAGMAASSACGGVVVGSGHPTTKTVNVQGFDRISVSVDSVLNVARTGSESVVVTADDNILPLLTVTVVDRTLRLGVDSTVSINGHVVFTVTAKALLGIDSAGDARVSATNIDAPAFATTMSGDGTVTLAGRSQSQTVDITGNGTYDGTHFAARDATVTVTGDGHAIVNASNTLKLETVGQSTVDYLGSPVVTQSGAGLIHRLRVGGA
jgi:hypothetical protein